MSDPDKFFRLSLDLLCIAGPDGYFKRVNPAFVRTLGWSESQLLSQPFVEFIHPDDVDPTSAEYEKLLSGTPTVSFENRYRCSDGRYRVLRWTAQPETDTGLVFAIARDVTDQVAAEARLRRSNAELQQFAYAASHDLQEPLRMIAGYLQLIERRYRGRLDGEADEFIGFAVDGARRMQRMIQGMLEYVRVESAGGEFERFDSGDAVDQVLEKLETAIETSGATVSVGSLPTIHADRDQFGRIFENLIDNAIKFRGTPEPEISVIAETENGDWIFTVRDDGPGVDPRETERVFGLFERGADAASKYRDGVGVGLAICKRIVDRHGGRIWIEPGDGTGTTVRFTVRRDGHAASVVSSIGTS